MAPLLRRRAAHPSGAGSARVGCGMEFMGHVPRYLASLKREARYAVRIRGWHEPFSRRSRRPAAAEPPRRHKVPLPEHQRFINREHGPSRVSAMNWTSTADRVTRARDVILTVLGHSADPLLLARRLLNHTPRGELEARMVRRQRRRQQSSRDHLDHFGPSAHDGLCMPSHLDYGTCRVTA